MIDRYCVIIDSLLFLRNTLFINDYCAKTIVSVNDITIDS